MTPLEKRHAATEATLARYRGRAFKWGPSIARRWPHFT